MTSVIESQQTSSGTHPILRALPIIATIALLALPRISAAADIRVLNNENEKGIVVIEGVIEPGDSDKFIHLIRDNHGQISNVSLASPGGDFDEAMKIGRAMRALELVSTAPTRDPSGNPSCFPTPHDPTNCTCASACFFIHIGGVFRGGTFLAVHRPYFVKGQFGNLSEDEAKHAFDALQNRARDYMTEMGVPKHIQEDVLGTSSDNALILDEKTVKTYFWGDMPYRHEWERNKCSPLSDDETALVNSDLSKSAQDVSPALLGKYMAELNCRALLEKQRQASAYEKYFGVKTN